MDLILSFSLSSRSKTSIFPGIACARTLGRKAAEYRGGKTFLDDIEHRILRPIWKDNRVHYAVNCASLGCPNLQPAAYTSENTEVLLEKGARVNTSTILGA